MPIVERLAATRARVLWLGIPPSASDKELLQRFQLEVDDSLGSGSLASDELLAATAAVILNQDATKPNRAVDLLRLQGARILNFDCLLFVLASASGLASVVNTLKAARIPSIWPTAGPAYEVFEGGEVRALTIAGEPLFPHARVYRQPGKIEIIGNLILTCRATSSIAPSNPAHFRITGPGSNDIKRPQLLMLRKAYQDCEEVHLRRLDDGRSPAQVYVAHSRLRGSQLIARPMPAFVKIGPRSMIAREWRTYEFFVREFVPFHLGPRLIKDRCSLGAHKGIIVGDFVEDSESLKECAVAGRGLSPIGALFDRTLRGWHYHPATQVATLSKVMRGFMKSNIPPSRFALAKSLGATKHPGTLRHVLENQSPEELLWGRIHGDLHADNVRVRQSDAILIDFFSSRAGPLLIDPAALEVGVVIRAPDNAHFQAKPWQDVVLRAFNQDYFRGRPIPVDSTDPYAWISVALRQVRLHAYSMQLDASQYARVLAFHLFRSASKDHKVSAAEELRRAFALVLCEKLLGMTW